MVQLEGGKIEREVGGKNGDIERGRDMESEMKD